MFCIMNAVTPIPSVFATVDFAPAYRQLQPLERQFVDAYVSDVERIAGMTGQRLVAVLQRPLPPDLDQRSRGMLARPMVRAAISDRVRELSEVMEVSAYRTIKELKSLAYSNMADFIETGMDGKANFVDFTTLTREQMASVQSIKIEDNPKTGRKVQLQLHPKLGSLETLMKYQGLLTDDNPHYKQTLETEKTIDQLPANVSDDMAADTYARTLNQ